jgi:hypothetical protein
MANQILSGAVFQAGQVIAGIDADTILDTFIAPQLLTTTSTRWMIVGAYLDDDNGDSSGSVYVYDATDLSAQPTKLTAFDGTERDKFGNAVAATDDKIIVGAYKYGNDGNDYVGSVYVYDANDLTAQPTKLTAFDSSASDEFGISVSATADKIVVGAYQDDDNGNNSGSVYVYDANDLTAQPTKLTSFDGVGDDLFGNAVSVTADKIVVGATFEGDGGWPGSGSVYVYDANDLTAQPTKLTPFDGAGGDRFGESVFATVDKIVVGAWRDDDNGNDSGSVYVYDLSDLSAQPTKLTAFDGAANHRFGYSVAATVDKIIVGAEQDDDNGSYSGSVYVYDATDLSAQPTKLTPFDGAEDDHFGYSLDAVSNTLLVGSFYDDGQGSSYIYDLDDLSAQPTKLTAFDGAASDFFGRSVALCVETTTIPLPAFIAPPAAAAPSQQVVVRGQHHYNNNMGRVIVYNAVDNSIISTIDGTEAGRKLGYQVLVTDDYILASTTRGVWNDDTTSSIHAYSTSDLTADPIIIGHPEGKGNREFGQSKGQLAVGNGKLFVSDDSRIYICDLSNLSAAPVPFEFESGSLNASAAILVFNPYDNYLYVGQKNAYGGDGAITRFDTNTMLTTGGSPETIYSVDADLIGHMNFGRNIAIFEDCLYVSAKHAEGSPFQSVYKYNTSSFVSGHTAVPYLSKWTGSAQSLGPNDGFGSSIGSISASSKGTIIGAPDYGASDWNGGYVNTGRVYYIQNHSNGTSSGLTQLNTSSMNLQHNEWAGGEVYTDENYVYAKFYGRSFPSANAVAVWSWDDISAAPTILQTEYGSLDIGSTSL